jgi:hypothetical protein
MSSKVEGNPLYGTNRFPGLGLAIMTIFSVLHKTIYRYKTPVRLGLHELLIRPRDSFDQRLLDCRLNVTPAPAEVRWIHAPKITLRCFHQPGHQIFRHSVDRSILIDFGVD